MPPLEGEVAERSEVGGVSRYTNDTPSVSPFGLTAPPEVEPRALRAVSRLA